MKEYSKKEIIENAILISQTFNTYAQKPKELNPSPLENTELTKDWNVVGHITSNNGFLSDFTKNKDNEVFFGYLLQSKVDSNEYKAVIRGTANKAEWADNFKSLMEFHKEVGCE